MTSVDANSPEPVPPLPAGPRTFRDWLRDMPRWKKLALAAAVVTSVVGAVLTLTADAAPAGGNLSNLSSGLTDGRTMPAGNGTTTAEASGEPAAKGVFRLGFSFVAGFCLGSFVRATLKIAAIAFGFWLCMTLVLNYYGILTVDWQAMDSLWNRFAGNVESEWGSFQTFMTGSLPAAGLAATGLVIGLKRH
jgi:uncharacterized membrane protein (Fun14 family)